MTNLDPQTTADFWDAYVRAAGGGAKLPAVDAPRPGEAPIRLTALVVEIEQPLQPHPLIHRERRCLRGELVGT
jgi:hypothetical protein